MTLRRVLVGVLLPTVLVGLVAFALWGAVEAARAIGGARQARAAATALQQDLDDGSWDAASEEADRFGTAVDQAVTALASPPLRLAGALPVGGRDVRAARQVALGLQDASHAARPLVEATRGLTPGSLVRDGRIDLARLEALVPAAAAADRGLTSAQRRIDAIDASTLHQPLRADIADLQRRLRDLQARGATALLERRLQRALQGAAGAAGLVPAGPQDVPENIR